MTANAVDNRLRTVRDIDRVLDAFREWANAEGLQVDAGDVVVEFLGVPHQPVPLRQGWQGVYAFQLGPTWLKVGKAGPNSNARWTSQHYGTMRALSTLAWSLFRYAHASSLQHPKLPEHLRDRLAGVHPNAMGDWIKRNTARVNVSIQAHLGSDALTALERAAQAELRPVFEGRWETGTTW